MINTENYITQIKQLLDKTGWSQTQLSREIGVSFATINRWIRGHAKPHVTHIRQIEKLFKNIIGIVPLPEGAISAVLGRLLTKKRKFKNVKKIFRQSEIIQEFLLELTYHSDAIEGSTLTKKETEAIIFDKGTVKDKSLIEHLEATNHAVVLRDILEGRISGPISEDLIKNLHKVLMQGIREDGGHYAKLQRGIRGVDLILPHPSDIPEEMKLLCQKINNPQGHPIEHIAKMHADFEAVHPFGDGNGRVGRLIMIIQLLNEGFAPCVIMVNNRAQYYECLEYAQKRSPSHFVHFLAESVLKGYGLIEKYIKR